MSARRRFVPASVGLTAFGLFVLVLAAQEPRKPTNLSAPVPQGRMPNRVHVFEDYETEIEKRWWLRGTPEVKNVPPGSTRACRAAPSKDFDDKMGDPKATYHAVVFNPVPGPPVGPNTRLSFRCWLQGTGTLRVQIFSLTNNYHRHLTLTDLPQGRWAAATVDMTQALRPDGSGGPLSENERIDDIQFYVDPPAELIIDDIVLYDAALPDEQRPFPKRVIFTGWFDTGQQGKEWPGAFAIVAKPKPHTWKAAKSVPNPETGTPWVRMHLRGERPLGAATHLRFRYLLTGGDRMQLHLANSKTKDNYRLELTGLKQGEWAEATVDFAASQRTDGRPGTPKAGDRVEELWFVLPKGAELLVDDVLLYEPGE